MTNINSLVRQYLDARIELQKTLAAGLLNTSALARQIAKEQGLVQHIDAIISAVRRYEVRPGKKEKTVGFYTLLKKAKIATHTKLGSVLIRRTDETEKKVGKMYAEIGSRRNTTLRIFEVTNYIKIIVDEELLEVVAEKFSKSEIEAKDTGLGELTINYADDITKIPGVFATLSNEMSLNDVSIVDSMICHWEHLLIVEEKDLQKAFAVVHGLSV